MAAKDYKICPAIFNAYIAKVSKCDPNKMTDDRRPIEEGEIMMLIDWYLNNELGEKYKSISFNSHAREGKKVLLQYIDKEDEQDDYVLVEQNPAWSEKDEEMRLTVMQDLQNIKDSYPNVNVEPEFNWLKSLKERCTWKPSEEQIKAVRLARAFVVDDFDENPTLSEILVELEKQLKKL